MGAGHGVTALYEVVPLGAATPVADSGDLKYQRTEATPAQRNGEALTLKVRYKEPRAATSVERVKALAWSREPMERAAGDLRFAAGIAQWGMLLGESAHKAGSNYESAIGLVEGAVGADSDGRRAEAVYLMKTARALVAAAK